MLFDNSKPNIFPDYNCKSFIAKNSVAKKSKQNCVYDAGLTKYRTSLGNKHGKSPIIKVMHVNCQLLRLKRKIMNNCGQDCMMFSSTILNKNKCYQSFCIVIAQMFIYNNAFKNINKIMNY